MRLEFTPREVAELAGAPKSAVEKAIEERVIRVRKVRRGRRMRRVLPAHAVAYAKILRTLKYRMDPGLKRRLASTLARIDAGAWPGSRFELEPAVEVDVGRLVGETMARAEAYGAARDKAILEDPEILGGTPVIRGTRLSVYAIRGRLDGGDTIEAILEDYPHLTRDMVEAAAIYARSHPLVGRPGGRPWAAA